MLAPCTYQSKAAHFSRTRITPPYRPSLDPEHLRNIDHYKHFCRQARRLEEQRDRVRSPLGMKRYLNKVSREWGLCAKIGRDILRNEVKFTIRLIFEDHFDVDRAPDDQVIAAVDRFLDERLETGK
jgi:hypothetical protein